MLRYADELVETSQLEFPAGEKVRKAELDMAKMLIENLAAEWDPSKYTDEYRENLMKLIKARIKGEKPKLPSAEPPPEGKVVDLMERLRQSLAQNQKPAPAREAGETRARGADKDPREEEDPPRGVMAMRRLLATILLLAIASASCRETGDVQVTSIEFSGANAVKADELKAVLATRESGFLPWSRKRFFDRPEFDRDVKRIEAYYADRGYPKRESRRRRRRAERREGQGRHHR